LEGASLLLIRPVTLTVVWLLLFLRVLALEVVSGVEELGYTGRRIGERVVHAPGEGLGVDHRLDGRDVGHV